MSSIGSKRTSLMVVAGLLAIGLLALFAAGCGGDDESGSGDSAVDPSAIAPNKPAPPVPGFEEGTTAQSLAAALQSQLTEDDKWQPYMVKQVKVNNDGFTILTELPPGQASIAKVDRLCTELGSPDVFKLLVFGTGPEPLSGKSCGQGP